jgi:hypothetical protein
MEGKRDLRKAKETCACGHEHSEGQVKEVTVDVLFGAGLDFHLQIFSKVSALFYLLYIKSLQSRLLRMCATSHSPPPTYSITSALATTPPLTNVA